MKWLTKKQYRPSLESNCWLLPHPFPPLYSGLDVLEQFKQRVKYIMMKVMFYHSSEQCAEKRQWEKRIFFEGQNVKYLLRLDNVLIQIYDIISPCVHNFFNSSTAEKSFYILTNYFMVYRELQFMALIPNSPNFAIYLSNPYMVQLYQISMFSKSVITVFCLK